MATIVFESKVKRAAGIAKEAWKAGLEAVAPLVEAEIKALVSESFPPASRPLRPPHKRTGNYQRGVNVRVEPSRRGRAASLVVESDEIYGPMLELGTVNMAPRPHARVVLLAGGRRGTKLKKKWTNKIARVAKTTASRKTRKTTGNRQRS